MNVKHTATIAALTLLVLTSGLTGAAATAPAQQNDTDLDSHPEDGSYEVEIRPRGPGETNLVYIRYYYPPRSAAEQRQAENHSLDTPWFRDEETLGSAVEYHNWSRQDFDAWSVLVDYQPTIDRIEVSRRYEWPGFMRDSDRVVLGPGFASQLEQGDRMHIQIYYSKWDDWSANTEGTDGEAASNYWWTIGTDPEPRLVLNRSDYKDDDSDPLGPTPFLLPAVALALLAVAALRRRR